MVFGRCYCYHDDIWKSEHQIKEQSIQIKIEKCFYSFLFILKGLLDEIIYSNHLFLNRPSHLEWLQSLEVKNLN